MSNLEKAMKALSHTSGDIVVLFYFTFGLIIILVIIWTIFKIIEEKNISKYRRDKVEQYLEKGILYDEPRELGDGRVEYQIENCIFVQDQIDQYVHNRYDVILVRSSDDSASESGSDSDSDSPDSDLSETSNSFEIV